MFRCSQQFAKVNNQHTGFNNQHTGFSNQYIGFSNQYIEVKLYGFIMARKSNNKYFFVTKEYFFVNFMIFHLFLQNRLPINGQKRIFGFYVYYERGK
jgi:hypothetical protein